MDYRRRQLFQPTRHRVLANLAVASIAQLALASLTLYSVYWNLAPAFVPRENLWWLVDCGLGSGFWLVSLVLTVLLPALVILVITGAMHVYFSRDSVDWNAWLQSEEEVPPTTMAWLNVRRRWLWAPWYLTIVDLVVFVVALEIGDILPSFSG